MQPTNQERIEQTLSDLERLHKAKTVDLAKLQASLALESLMPGVFDNGPIKVQWTSTPISQGGGLRGVLIDNQGNETPMPENAASILGVTANDLTVRGVSS